MFAALHRFQTKMKGVLYAIILVVVALLVFGLYAKARGIQSVNFIEHQAASASQSTELLESISQHLAGIEQEIAGLRKETCLQSAGFNQSKIQECESTR